MSLGEAHLLLGLMDGEAIDEILFLRHVQEFKIV